MSILCPDCGAEYDVTLFAFDRRIRCDCGAWVELRTGHTTSEAHLERRKTAMRIESPAFGHEQDIPTRYTGEGADVSPPLHWSGVPDGTRELALICDDPDAPTEQPWVHWVIYKLPPDTDGLPEDVPADSRLEAPVTAFQGRNTWSEGQTIGYRGPLPPAGHGTHHYHFKLYALDTRLDLDPGVDKMTLRQAISGHVLAEAELIGKYER